MNGIFHYYAVKFLSLRSGFTESDSEIIAYSCQLVDRSLIPIQLKTSRSEPKSYTVPPTHHFGFWDKSQENEVWIPFHFFPSGISDSNLRKDKKVDPFNVSPNSEPVKELLISALKTRNPYRIGIALHTYADSWAHQNFVGKNSSFNKIENFTPVPPVGHAHIGRNPDIWSTEWIDPRLIPEQQICNNDDRFMLAAEKIYKYLATHNRQGFSDWELIKWELSDIIRDNTAEPGNNFPRKNNVAKDPQLELEFRLILECEELDEKKWFSQTLGNSLDREVVRRGNTDRFIVAEHEIRKLLNLSKLTPRESDESFFTSDLYKWSEAAYEHKKTAAAIIRNVS